MSEQQRVITSRGGKALSSSLKFEPFAGLFWLSALHTIFVDFSLFVLLYNTNLQMNKLK